MRLRFPNRPLRQCNHSGVDTGHMAEAKQVPADLTRT